MVEFQYRVSLNQDCITSSLQEDGTVSAWVVIVCLLVVVTHWSWWTLTPSLSLEVGLRRSPGLLQMPKLIGFMSSSESEISGSLRTRWLLYIRRVTRESYSRKSPSKLQKETIKSQDWFSKTVADVEWNMRTPYKVNNFLTQTDTDMDRVTDTQCMPRPYTHPITCASSAWNGLLASWIACTGKNNRLANSI